MQGLVTQHVMHRHTQPKELGVNYLQIINN